MKFKNELSNLLGLEIINSIKVEGINTFTFSNGVKISTKDPIVIGKLFNRKLTYIDSRTLIFKDLSSITMDNPIQIEQPLYSIINDKLKKINSKVIIGIHTGCIDPNESLRELFIKNNINGSYLSSTDFIRDITLTRKFNLHDLNNDYNDFVKLFDSNLVLMDVPNSLVLDDDIFKANFVAVIPSRNRTLYKLYNYDYNKLYVEENVPTVVLNGKEDYFNLNTLDKVLDQIITKMKRGNQK